MTDRDICARLAVRWFGWEWWRDKRRGLCALLPPDEERCNYPIEPKYIADNYEQCDGVPPVEQRFTDWHRCWSMNGLPKYDEDGNAMLSLLEKLREKERILKVLNGHTYHGNRNYLAILTWRGSSGRRAFADTLPQAVAAAADKIPERK